MTNGVNLSEVHAVFIFAVLAGELELGCESAFVGLQCESRHCVTDYIYSGFLQDRIEILPSHLSYFRDIPKERCIFLRGWASWAKEPAATC